MIQADFEGWDFYCFVRGEPKAKGSPSIRRHGNKRTLTVHSRTCEQWEREISRVARIHAPPKPFEGALQLVTAFELTRPKTAKRDKPSVKPDFDKLVRAVADGITRAGVWNDDSQVTTALILKAYAEPGTDPGVGIYVSRDRS